MGKRSKQKKQSQSATSPQVHAEDHGQRLFESANTTRLNADQWGAVTDQPINYALQQDLEILQKRCHHERHNNPMVEGVVETHVVDMLGETGPSLQVVSDSPRYNALLEEIWGEWWASCTCDEYSGLDLLQRWLDNDWWAGNSLAQFCTMNDLPGESIIKTRLLDIAPQRLSNNFAWGEKSINGVRVDEYNRPTHYYLQPRRDRYSSLTRPIEVVADDIIHWFKKREADQVVGYPLLAGSLQEIADLRSYDTSVMDAARTAADNAFLLQSQAGSIQLMKSARPIAPGTTIQTPRKSGRVIPVGYEAKQLQAVHPLAQYIDFRHEKLRSIGRPVHMPLLLVLLSASKSNFSQSRIDVNVFYERGLNSNRGRVERRALTPLAKMIEREASLATYRKSGSNRFVLGRKPRKVEFNWGWEPLGHANPKDYANSVKTLLELGLTSEIRELCKMGIKPQQIMEDRQLWEKMKTDFGLMVEEVSPGGQSVARAQFDLIRDEMEDMRQLLNEALAS